MSDEWIIIILMVFMAISGVAIARLHNLFAVVMLAGIFSLLGSAA